MKIILPYLTLFIMGGVAGWILEVFFRRFFSQKKWVNPGFLNGPFLPLYGTGVCLIHLLYTVIPDVVPWYASALIVAVALNVLELLVGLFFLYVMKTRLWDYRKRPGNFKGVVCPLFAVFWTTLAFSGYFVNKYALVHISDWVGQNHWWFNLMLGMFTGGLLGDTYMSFEVAFIVRKYAKGLKEFIHFDKLKTFALEQQAEENKIRKEKKQKKFFVNWFAPLLKDSQIQDSFVKFVNSVESRIEKQEKEDAKKKAEEEQEKADLAEKEKEAPNQKVEKEEPIIFDENQNIPEENKD